MTMTQRIITVCDAPHEEEELAQTIQLALSLDGGRGFQMVEVDLCPKHAQPLGTLMEELLDVGRPFRAPGLRQARRASLVPPEAQEEQRAACPSCDHIAQDEAVLRQHVRMVHDMSLEQARGDQLDHWCPAEGCGRGFSRKQSLGVHLRAKHPELVSSAA